jgi:hypothetical protein
MGAAAIDLTRIHRFIGVDDPEGGPAGKLPRHPDDGVADQLSYKVELWDPRKATVELVLAATASGSIGFAAYHAATREFPDRYIVLRHRDAVIARWNGPAH